MKYIYRIIDKKKTFSTGTLNIMRIILQWSHIESRNPFLLIGHAKICETSLLQFLLPTAVIKSCAIAHAFKTGRTKYICLFSFRKKYWFFLRQIRLQSPDATTWLRFTNNPDSPRRRRDARRGLCFKETRFLRISRFSSGLRVLRCADEYRFAHRSSRSLVPVDLAANSIVPSLADDTHLVAPFRASRRHRTHLRCADLRFIGHRSGDRTQQTNRWLSDRRPNARGFNYFF